MADTKLTLEELVLRAIERRVSREGITAIIEGEVERVFDKTLRQRVIDILYEAGVPAKEDLRKMVQIEVKKGLEKAQTPGRNYTALLSDDE